MRKLIGEMEFTEDIIAGDARYASESDDRLLAEMAAGHIEELSTAGRQLRKTIQVPIVVLAEVEEPECCCNAEDDIFPEADIFEAAAERDALFAEPEIDVISDGRPESPVPVASPVRRAVIERDREGGAAAILAQLCWALGGCGAGGLLYWLLLA